MTSSDRRPVEMRDMAGEILTLLRSQLNEMTPQVQTAARFILERPQDVMLLSMRELASAAGVSHSTIMRLSEWLGLDGYAALRQIFISSFREGAVVATTDSSTPEKSGEEGKAPALIASSIKDLAADKAQSQLAEATGQLMKARKIVVVGSAQETPVIGHARQLFQALGSRVQTPDQFQAADATEEGVCLLVISLRPHGPKPKDAVRLARRLGVPSLAITDSPNALVAKMADISVIFRPASIALNIPSLTPAIAAIEAITSIWRRNAG
ncbi:MurR/RpiR family transcriptional regulator [Brucella cytisi]|uniref:MurR/RpiR family transcriptional regulator n=1 Tax=Brucella cytisi TaxID=407152 RepID=UPI0016A35BDA|nr:MurR/RpiR family transcriptional regulator [Brucella cytisi]